MKKYISKRDAIIIAAAVALCAAALVLLSVFSSGGAVAEVAHAGEVIKRIPLDEDGIYTIKGDLEVTLEVSGSAIRFVNSLCPDHVCEGYGWLSEEHDCAVCMPARVIVTVRNGG